MKRMAIFLLVIVAVSSIAVTASARALGPGLVMGDPVKVEKK